MSVGGRGLRVAVGRGGVGAYSFGRVVEGTRLIELLRFFVALLFAAERGTDDGDEADEAEA